MFSRFPEDAISTPERLKQAALDELQLFERIRQADRGAFEQLFRTYHGRLCSFVNDLVRSREVAKDIVQALFQKIWENRENIHIRISTNAYLYRGARNLALDFLKHQKIEQEWRDQELLQDSGNVDPSEILDQSRLLDAVQRSIDKLPPRCRLIFQMHWREGLSYREIATILDLSVKTVEAQMGRALSRLRDEFHH